MLASGKIEGKIEFFNLSLAILADSPPRFILLLKKNFRSNSFRPNIPPGRCLFIFNKLSLVNEACSWVHHLSVFIAVQAIFLFTRNYGIANFLLAN